MDERLLHGQYVDVLQRIRVVNDQDVCCLVDPAALDPEVRTLGEHLGERRLILEELWLLCSTPSEDSVTAVKEDRASYKATTIFSRAAAKPECKAR